MLTATGRHSIAISEDGRQIAFVANSRIYVRSLSDLEAKTIPGAEGFQSVTTPAFSPDGLSLAFYALNDQTLRRIAVTGGSAVPICPATNPYGMTWTPDGIVFGQGRGGIMRVSPNGGKPEQLVAVKEGELAHGPQILPGNQHVLFTLAPSAIAADRWDKARIVVQSLTTKEQKTIIEGGADGRHLPTGHLVYALGGSLYDSVRREASGGRRRRGADC